MRVERLCRLPAEKSTSKKPPFTFVGIDYFGAIEVKQGRSCLKRYACLFSFLSTRAVHIEVAHALDTDSMLITLGRFVGIRGCLEELRSDRGSNFTRADEEQKKD